MTVAKRSEVLITENAKDNECRKRLRTLCLKWLLVRYTEHKMTMNDLSKGLLSKSQSMSVGITFPLTHGGVQLNSTQALTVDSEN